MDSKQFYRCAPKLSHSHIYPTNFEKMRVRLAVQVLSHTVAAGMNLCMNLGALPNEAIGTIEILEKCINLFDILNLSFTSEKNKFKKVFEGNEFQIRVLNKMLDFFKQLKVFNKNNQDITSQCRFVRRCLITIAGVKKTVGEVICYGF